MDEVLIASLLEAIAVFWRKSFYTDLLQFIGPWSALECDNCPLCLLFFYYPHIEGK